MLHVEDERSIRRMLGLDEVPDDLRAEYEMCLGMYHRDGNSGPLGSVGVISVIRRLGYGPPKEAKRENGAVWRQLPQDGSVKVEVKRSGQWRPGVFLGFVEAGTLAIRLEEDPLVLESRPCDVRPAGSHPLEPDGEAIEAAHAPPQALDYDALKVGDPVRVLRADGPPQKGVFVEIVDRDESGHAINLAVELEGQRREIRTSEVLIDGSASAQE